MYVTSKRMNVFSVFYLFSSQTQSSFEDGTQGVLEVLWRLDWLHT